MTRNAYPFRHLKQTYQHINKLQYIHKQRIYNIVGRSCIINQKEHTLAPQFEPLIISDPF